MIRYVTSAAILLDLSTSWLILLSLLSLALSGCLMTGTIGSSGRSSSSSS